MIEQLSAPRVDEREWVRQQEELAYLLAKRLNMSRWQYVDTLPIFTPQPAEYQGRFDNVVVVQPPKPEKELSLKTILKIVGLSYNSGVLNMRDWRGDKGGFRIPVVPYATWLEDGERNLGVRPSVVRDSLSKDARGGTGLDGVFLYVADRGVLRRHYLVFPGSEEGAGRAPVLRLWDDGPRLVHRWVGHTVPGGGSVVAGRKIVLGKLAA